MNTIKAWLIANAEILYLILQIVFTVIMWCLFPDKIGEDGEPTNDGLVLGLGALAITGAFLWFVKSWKAAIVTIVGVLVLLGLLVFHKELDVPSSVKIWGIVCASIAFVLGLILSVASYRNFDEVVSRRFLYRNSCVSVFEERFKYAITRFYVGFIAVFSLALEVITVIVISGTN